VRACLPDNRPGSSDHSRFGVYLVRRARAFPANLVRRRSCPCGFSLILATRSGRVHLFKSRAPTACSMRRTFGVSRSIVANVSGAVHAVHQVRHAPRSRIRRSSDDPTPIVFDPPDGCDRWNRCSAHASVRKRTRRRIRPIEPYCRWRFRRPSRRSCTDASFSAVFRYRRYPDIPSHGPAGA